MLCHLPEKVVSNLPDLTGTQDIFYVSNVCDNIVLHKTTNLFLFRGWQLLQAVDWGPACPQPSEYTGATKGVRDVDEDCLYLNIFTPSVSMPHTKNT